jgi:hypothetical protein
MFPNHSNSGLFLAQKNDPNMDPAQASALKKLQKTQTESYDNALWASAQGLALAKLKVFHAMAKSVNDQQ